jgi:3-hydroxymyristoyl/3-hydroxydecanoyl-(acyl carrier protein) dehydratase
MRVLPEILAERPKPGGVELELRVPGDLACLAGHFPGLPVLPGVVQIDWSIKLARTRLELRGEFAAAENLKFLSIVRPEDQLTLGLELPAPTRLVFRYFRRDKKYSSGTLVFIAS